MRKPRIDSGEVLMTDPRIGTARESNNDQGFHSGLPAEGPDPDAEDDRDE